MRSLRRRLAVVLAACALPTAAAAWPGPAENAPRDSGESPAPPAMRLEDLEQRAREHNPAMASAEAALRTVEAQIEKAGADAARAQKLAQTRDRLLAERQRMAMKLRTLFFHALHNQRRVESRERLAKVAREAAGLTDRLFNVGAADGPDRLAIENEAQVLEAALVSARFEMEDLHKILAETVGDPALELGELDGDEIAALPRIDPEEWRQRLLRESPSLQEVQAEIAEKEEALERARGEPDGTAAAAAEAALAQARLRAEQVRLTLEVGFSETYSFYQAAVLDLETYRGGVVERAERAYLETLHNYQQMTAAYPQVLAARRALFQLQDAELDAVQNAWSAAIDIQALLPYELPQNLAPPIGAPATPAPAAPAGKPQSPG
jgi:outer membrane protein TolC